MAKILIKNGRVWDGERLFRADVLTKDNTVARIAPHVEEEADFIWDAEGQSVLPGLVDLHVHLKGVASDRYGIQAEMSSFPFGVTAVNDAGSGAKGSKERLEGFAVKSTSFVGTAIRDNHFLPAVTEDLLQRYGDKAIGIKIYFDPKVCEVWDITPLREACAYARGRGLAVMVHSANSPVPMTEVVAALSRGDIITVAAIRVQRMRLLLLASRESAAFGSTRALRDTSTQISRSLPMQSRRGTPRIASAPISPVAVPICAVGATV